MYDEILAAAWPVRPRRVYPWHEPSQTWQEDVSWNPQDPLLHRDVLLGDPLPLMAVCVDAERWVVPATDGTVWWWIVRDERPDRLPVFADSVQTAG